MTYKHKIYLAAFLVFCAFIAWFFYQNSQTNKNIKTSDDALVSIHIPQDLSAKALQGKAAFDANCAQCHGEHAVGRNGQGPPLIHKIYEPNHHGDMAFYRAAFMGVVSHHWKFGNMPKIEGISEQEVALIIDYIRTLQRANEIF